MKTQVNDLGKGICILLAAVMDSAQLKHETFYLTEWGPEVWWDSGVVCSGIWFSSPVSSQLRPSPSVDFILRRASLIGMLWLPAAVGARGFAVSTQ